MNSRPHRADLLTYGEAAALLAARPAVILPLGGCEPFGGGGRIGIETLCAERISDELSTRCGILCAPPLPFGCSTPFISFPGAAGVKPRTFVNMLCEIIQAYCLLGAKHVFLVNAAPFNKTPAEEAAKRLEAKYGGVKVAVFDVNTLVNFNNNMDRKDAALLAMAAYLDRERINIDTSGINTSGISINTSGINTYRRKRATADQYRAWKKRGADPQKLRKLFPDGLLLPPDDDGATLNITPERGKELFDGVAGFIQERIEKALTTGAVPEAFGL